MGTEQRPHVNDESVAFEASRKDLQASTEFGAQYIKYLVTLNSGAALASLAFIAQMAKLLSDDIQSIIAQKLITYSSVSLVIFVVGAVSGAASAKLLLKYRQEWAYAWENHSVRLGMGIAASNVHHGKKMIGKWNRWSNYSSALSAVSFLFGVLIISFSIWIS